MGLLVCEIDLMRHEAVIGLEIHIQLATASKLFSPSPTAFGARRNTHVDEIDLGYPGVLPVVNEKAVEYACLFGRALGGRINRHAVFMRKNYFYPDLPKGYQISQLDDAIIQGGEVCIEGAGGAARRIRIDRGQLEEDAGKSVHDAFAARSGIDLNRAGVPLIELVSEPDMRSAGEAVAYMRRIHQLVRYLGISDGNMEEGSLRCDANVSIRPQGSKVLNPRVELKNINSFRFIEQAIQIEIERQSEIVAAGGRVAQETRLFDPDRRQTRTMRRKEEANDYRYFPDPDLLPLEVTDAFLDRVTASLPELPETRARRYGERFALDDDTASMLVQTRAAADYFDALCAVCGDGKLAANWQTGELARLMNQHGRSFEDLPLDAERLGQLLLRIKDQTISGNNARKVMQRLWEGAESADRIIAELGLKQVSDDAALQEWVAAVLGEHPDQVAAYRGGQEKMLGFFVGQVMRRSQGQANPKAVNVLIRKALER